MGSVSSQGGGGFDCAAKAYVSVDDRSKQCPKYRSQGYISKKSQSSPSHIVEECRFPEYSRTLNKNADEVDTHQHEPLPGSIEFTFKPSSFFATLEPDISAKDARIEKLPRSSNG